MSIFRKFFKNLFFKRKIFLIGDLHLDHRNIIRYCHRPFKSLKHMNAVILKNWNRVVNKRDIVYFLGDLTFRSKKVGYWLKRLNGTIIVIGGNHDKGIRGRHFKKILIYQNFKFLLIHDPRNIPKDWHGWVIHGHKHNNHMRDYPFVNGLKKTINVSCELINYTPLNIDDLLKHNLNDIFRWKYLNGKPVYKKVK